MRKRRSNGLGSIFYSSQKDCWVGRIKTAKGTTQVQGKSEADVQRKLLDLPRERRSSSAADNVSVAEWLERWLEMQKHGRVEYKTLEGYETSINRHIKPFIGPERLSALTVSDVDVLMSGWRRRNVGTRAQQKALTTLRKSLRAALARPELGVTFNVATAVDPPTHIPQKKRLLTADELKKFREVAKGNRLYALFVLAVDTGLREGELLGLRREDVNLNAGTLRVRQQAKQVTDGTRGVGKLKTSAATRVVTLPQATVGILREHLKKNMSVGTASTLVFPSKEGTPINPSNLRMRYFKKVLEKAELPDIPFHALRGSHATLLAENGAHIKAVQERLGHARPTMTQQYYVNSTTKMQDEVRNILDETYAEKEDEIEHA